MPAWNQRYREIDLWGLPLNLLVCFVAALAGLILAALMLLGGNWLAGLLLASLSAIAIHGSIGKLALGIKRPFAAVITEERQLRACRYNDAWESELPTMRDYEKRKLPRQLHRNCMLNDDGSVSAALRFNGFALYLDAPARARAHNCLRSLLPDLDKNYIFEFHLCRQADQQLSNSYKNQPIRRQQRITRWVRERIADQIAGREYRNCVYLLITATANPRGWLGAARTLAQQTEKIQPLLTLAEKILEKLPGGCLDTAEAYRNILSLVNDRRCDYSYDSLQQCHGWFAGGRIDDADGFLRLADGRYLKSLWLESYPDAELGFICRLTQPPMALHIVQAIKTVSVYDRQSIQRDINISASMASGANLAGARIKLKAHNDMQSWCASTDNELYWNFFAIQLIDDSRDRIANLVRYFEENLTAHNARVRAYPEIQYAAWHYMLPGSAQCARRWRVDETEQLIGMAPVHVPNRGAAFPLSLRLSTQNTPVNIGYRRGDVAHHVTIAMTGAGKSLDRCARILESYGLGIDIYALEIGQSLWWAIEAVGGQYHRLDPDEIMINPLPDRDCCTNNELSIDVMATTTVALSMLLTENDKLDQFELTATQIAMRQLYARPGHYPNPKLQHLHRELENLEHNHHSIVNAAKKLADHLGAFLESAEGQRLMQLPQLNIRSGAVGCDLAKIKEKTPSLLKFYLVFITLKFSQLAYANNNPAEIVLDEMHEFVRHAPEVVGGLIEAIARMGRKNANFINLITQEETEIEAIGSSVLNQVLRKCLMYKQSGHQDLARRIGMPDEVSSAWRAWQNPLSANFRYALECIDGDEWQELILLFPEEIAILSRTDPLSLDLKQQISQSTKDPLERIEMFRQLSAARLADTDRQSSLQNSLP